MSHSEWPVIPPVLNRRGEIKNKAVLKTTKTSVGQPHQGRGDIKHTQIQPNRWFVSTITLAHISCMLRHTLASTYQGLGRECHGADQLHWPGRWRVSWWNQTEYQWLGQAVMCLQSLQCVSRTYAKPRHCHPELNILRCLVMCRLCCIRSRKLPFIGHRLDAQGQTYFA